MKTPTLSPVYVDDEPVSLMGDPRPSIAKIIAATGRDPKAHKLHESGDGPDLHGPALDPNLVVDRLEDPKRALYFSLEA